MSKWAIVVCDCGYNFAVPEEPNFQACPNCGSEDTSGSGEYLSDTLYTESGKVIEKGEFPKNPLGL